MSSALLWIILPVLAGAALLLYRRDDTFPLFAAAGFCLMLSWAAWQLPVDVVMQIGPFSIEIAPSFVMFGRSFTLTAAQMPLLAFIYLLLTLWIAAAYLARPGRLFVPLSLISVGLLVAALAVEPFLYAALLLGMAAVLQVPLLAPPGAAGAGIMRFLKFQVFAVPFILFTGWILSGVEASPGNVALEVRAGMLLMLGFAFLLGLFPLHSWLPMLARQSHPYVFGFLAFFLPSIGLIFALGFFDRYGWLRASEFAHPLLMLAGGISALVAGLLAARERHVGRLLSFGGMLSTGVALQALGLGAQSAQVFFALLLPQAFAIWVWATALSMLGSGEDNNDVDSLAGHAAKHPLAAAGLLLAIFSLAGLPLLGSFPGRVALLDGVAAEAPWAALATLIGSLGLVAAGVRVLAVVIAGFSEQKRGWEEEAAPPNKNGGDLSNPYVWVFIAVAVTSLLGFGLLPRLFLSSVPDLAAMFSQLRP